MPRNCTGTDSIQPGIIEPLQPTRIAGIGVYVDHALFSTRTYGLNNLLDSPPLQQWLTFTSLTKADNGFFGLLQVWHSNFDNLLNAWNEDKTILRRDQVFLFLLRDAANATGIAARR